MSLKIVNYLLFVHILALMTSTAAMGISGALLVLSLLTLIFQKVIQQRNVVLVAPDSWPLLLGYLVITFASLYFNYSASTLRESFVDVRWVLVFAATFVALLTAKFEERNFKVFYCVLLIVGAYSLIQGFTGWDFKRGTNSYPLDNGLFRPTGFFNNPITYANILQIYLCFLVSFFLMQWKEKKRPVLKASVIAILAGVLVLSNTRACWISATLGLILVIGFHSKKMLLSFLVLMGILGGGLYLGSNQFKERIDSTFMMSHPTNNGRQVIWRTHKNVWQDNFWFGVGAGQNGREALKYATEEEIKLYPIQTHAHNQLLDILATRGILGALMYLGIFGYFIYIGIVSIRKLPGNSFLYSIAVGALGALLALIVSGFPEANLEDNEITNNYAMVLSVLQWVHYAAFKK